MPTRPTDQFKSFAAPILNFEDSYISSPWFGSWYWAATVKPVSQGGIPADLPRVSLKLSFMEGGHNDFWAKFEQIKERLHHARDLERELGHRVLNPEEPLPAYEATFGAGPSSAAAAGMLQAAQALGSVGAPAGNLRAASSGTTSAGTDALFYPNSNHPEFIGLIGLNDS